MHWWNAGGHRSRSSCRVSIGWSLSAWLLLSFVSHGHDAYAAGEAGRFRRLQGEYVTLITDLPPQPAVDELPGVFDQAVGQWCDYFRIPREDVTGWHLRAYLMGHRERFREAGYLPDTIPDFPYGYHRGDELWVVEQPTDYYRRHLLLHEGTHAFMWKWLGGTGPAWYAEGMAELLATHRYHEGRLTLKIIPRDRDETPDWGRIKLIRQAVDAGQGRSVEGAWAFRSRQAGDVEAYAWSWAVVTLLDGHPRWRERFRALPSRLRGSNVRFQRALRQDLASDRPALDEAWLIFLDQLAYGYRVDEDLVTELPPRPWGQQAEIQVDSQGGWQSTGLMLRAGGRYVIKAEGRYRLNDEDPPWISEAGGVTIRYHRGWPLGILLAAVRPNEGPERSRALATPRPVGEMSQIDPTQDGVLFLRINERAGELSDNDGQIVVRVQELTPSPPNQPD